MRILVAEDERRVRAFVVRGLREEARAIAAAHGGGATARRTPRGITELRSPAPAAEAYLPAGAGGSSERIFPDASKTISAFCLPLATAIS